MEENFYPNFSLIYLISQLPTEKFPDSCKVAKLKPLLKKVSLTQTYNYRPLSFLPLKSKVMEKVI